MAFYTATTLTFGFGTQLFRRLATSSNTVPSIKVPLNVVNGIRRDGSGDKCAVTEPATGRPLAHFSVSRKSDVDLAVQAGMEAFAQWCQLSGTERGRLLISLGHTIRKHRQRIAELEVRDTGKVITEALADVDSGADSLEYYGGLASTIAGQHIQLPSGNFAYTRREPLGVSAGIGAWNFPFQVACWKAAPALAAGNTLVFKPSLLTPVTAAMLGDLAMETGIPAGVLNIVQGDAMTGRLLASHPSVAKVSLTGSVAAGRKVMGYCADGIKGVTLELGGKSPLILFADADVDNATTGVMLANFLSQGEVCSNGTRVFVERSIFDDVLTKCVQRANGIRIGDPLDKSMHMGAMISAEHADKVMGFIDRARTEGAEVACGGYRYHPTEPCLNGGSYIQPTILTNVSDTMEVAREEVFGPVMCIQAFDSEEEVIKRANNTDFGLAAGVYTRDLQRGHRVIAQLQAGTCYLNTFNMYPQELPFGGFKQSGLGREGGVHALEQYTQLKSVFVEMGDTPSPGF